MVLIKMDLEMDKERDILFFFLYVFLVFVLFVFYVFVCMFNWICCFI